MTSRVEERSFSLDGDVVLITGAVRGIGGAVVKRFVDDGALVGFTFRPTERNEGYAADLVAAVSNPDRVLPLAGRCEGCLGDRGCGGEAGRSFREVGRCGHRQRRPGRQMTVG